MLSECIYKVLMASGVVTSSDACDLSGAIEAAVQRPIADLMCQWKSGKISGDELADKLFSLFASTPSSAVLEAQGKQEPVAWLARGIHGGKVIAAKLHDYKRDADNTASVFIEHYGAAETVPLYAAPVVQPPCLWSCDDDENMPGTWDGACGAKWTFTDGGPTENDLRYCPQCGKPVIVEVIAAAEGKG